MKKYSCIRIQNSRDRILNFGIQSCSKMFRCKARKKPNREAYMDIR
jgi:hypothetical protein